MQVVVRTGFLISQLVIAGFYAWSAALMWGPFIAGTLASKLFVATIVFWPIVGLAVSSRGTRFFGLGITSALALLTAVHVLVVLAFVMNA